MHILVSNDDGIYAPGIQALAKAVLPLGQVTVVAPEVNHSATGHKKTLNSPLRVRLLSDHIQGASCYAVNGSPSDCVAVAALGFIKEPINIVIAGINSGPNLAQDLTYSGTVSIALEAAIFGYQGIAFSIGYNEQEPDYDAAAAIARKVTESVLQHQLPPLTILNVNIPASPVKGWKATRQGMREYRDELVTRLDPRGKPYYWIGGENPVGDVNLVDTDLWAIHQGYVSLTPVHLDLTAHSLLASIREWTLEV